MKLDIPLTQAGLKNAIRVLKQQQQWLQRKTDELAQELAERGMSGARIRFQNAEYDGMKDVSVSVQKTGENTYATVAVGSAVLFIEFGTGIRYAAPAHPDADRLGYIRGGYGKHQGLKEGGWVYEGASGGTHGRAVNNEQTKWHTYGNPANMCMYYTVQDLKRELQQIAKEVFADE